MPFWSSQFTPKVGIITCFSEKHQTIVSPFDRGWRVQCDRKRHQILDFSKRARPRFVANGRLCQYNLDLHPHPGCKCHKWSSSSGSPILKMSCHVWCWRLHPGWGLIQNKTRQKWYLVCLFFFFFLQISKVSQLLGRSWEVVEAELKFNVAFSLRSHTSFEQWKKTVVV